MNHYLTPKSLIPQLSLIAFFFLTALNAKAFVHRQFLNDGWKFRQARTLSWHKGTVPGTVHTDLMDNGIIRDPFIGQNEREVQWVDKEDWIYETTFDLDKLSGECDNMNLVFDGLDTYADIILNDSTVLETNNMFRQWIIPVSDIIKPQGNKLRVYFHSPVKVDLPKFESLPYRYEAGNDQSENGGIFDKRVSIFARKAGYHYGWDWGPRLVTSGIWRPVYLETWTGPKIEDVCIQTASIDADNAQINSTVEIYSDKKYSNLIISVADSDKLLAHKNISLNKGLNILTIPFNIENPRLWWCNGLGKPNLYNFKVKLSGNNITGDTKTVSTGIRHIEVVRDKDKDGRSFYFKLNGIPVFAKGANYIPCDNFLPRVTNETYRRTVQDAADANMNMLRVWGGGIYEDDRFYNLCDSLGIMVWQDFMFACSMYPAEGEMLDNIREEATYNVKRLRNHPCIALWCGNNECHEAWFNWGWKRKYEKQGYADLLWNQYQAVFHKLLPEVIGTYSPDIFYWPSSPYSDIDRSPDPAKGDSHMWRVWGGSQPIELYNEITGRFFSEYGFQSFPEIGTVLKYAPDTTQHYIDSDVMLAHQRAGADANRRIEKYLLDSYPRPKDFTSFLYMTQILQGDAIRTAIEAHRRNKPYCMGTLFWQHNDCWPVASWSSRDYYGNWKAQHYFAKKAFRDILLSVTDDNDTIAVHIVSDRVNNAIGVLTIESFTFDGTPIAKHSCQIDIPANGIGHVNFPKSMFFGNIGQDSRYVYSTLKTDDDIYENIFLPSSQKDIKLSKPQLSIDIDGENGQYTVTVSSDTFVRAFKMTLQGCEDYFFDDNYFDLIPGKKHSVNLKTGLSKDEIRNMIQWTSVYNATHS